MKKQLPGEEELLHFVQNYARAKEFGLPMKDLQSFIISVSTGKSPSAGKSGYCFASSAYSAA